MKLFLVRHGEAESNGQGESQLTPKGKEDCAKNAVILKQIHPSILKIFHSSKLRAKETALIFHEILGHHIACEVKEGITPNDSPEELCEEIGRNHESLMIVSHLPFLEKVAAIFLYGEEQTLPFNFEGGAVVILERKSGQWKLVGLLPNH